MKLTQIQALRLYQKMKQFGSPAEIIIITPPFSIWAIRLLQAQTHTQGSLAHWFHSTFSLTLLVGSTYEGSEVQKAANLVNTFMLFFPHPVRIFVQKVFPTLFKAFYAKFRRFALILGTFPGANLSGAK